MNAVCNASVKPQNTISIPANNKGKDISSHPLQSRDRLSKDLKSARNYKKLQLSRIATKISGYTRLAEPSANRSLQKSSLCDFLESGPRSPALDATRPNLVNHHPTRHQKAEAGASRFLIPRLRGFPYHFRSWILEPLRNPTASRIPWREDSHHDTATAQSGWATVRRNIWKSRIPWRDSHHATAQSGWATYRGGY